MGACCSSRPEPSSSEQVQPRYVREVPDGWHKITVLGALSVGKSSLVIRYITKQFEKEYDPFIEDNYKVQREIDGYVERMIVLDTAHKGESDIYPELQQEWVREAHGFILVYDITSVESFEYLKRVYEELAKLVTRDDLNCVLVANKADLDDAQQVTKSMQQELLKSWQSSRGHRTTPVPCFEVSVKNDEFDCIEDVFKQLLRNYRREHHKVS